MRSDKFRQTILGNLVIASLAFADGGPVSDTSAHLSGWPPAKSVDPWAPSDTLRSIPPVAAPTLFQKQEPDPGRAGDCIGSAATAFGGVLLAGTGVAYWMHFSEVNGTLERSGVNVPLVLPVYATVAIPVGVLMAGFGTANFFRRLFHRGSDD